MIENPLLADAPLPHFAEIRPDHIEPAVREVLTTARARIAKIAAEDRPTFASVVEPMEELHHLVARTWSPVSHLNAVLNSEALRSAYNVGLPLLFGYQTDIAQNEPLYRAYSFIQEHESASLDPVQRQLLRHALRDFRLAGIRLQAADKERLKAHLLEISALQARFLEHVLDATRAWSHHVTDKGLLRGLSEVVIEQAARRACEHRLDGWLLTLDQPTHAAVVTDVESEALRRTFYEAWITRASDRGPHAARWDNAELMEKIICTRHQVARILGFGNYAEYALTTRMAHSVEEVVQFLDELAPNARQAAAEEFEELQRFAGRKLAAWDVAHYVERLRRERYALSQEELRRYFPLPRVLSGLFEVAERLFGVRIRQRHGVSVWHSDVRYFELENVTTGQPVGAFYLDAFARSNKRSGAWMDECIGRRRLTSGTSLPVAHLVCNVLPPSDDHPALLTHKDVLTLFHEFGHCLHHLLTCIDYPSIAGVNGVALDAVELPSQLMENYAWHPDVLQRISAQFETGKALPRQVVERLRATRTIDAGLQMAHKIELSLFDLRVHAEYSPEEGARIAQTLHEVRRKVSVVPVPEWNRFANSFRHIFAGRYASGVYSYIWADVLAADAFSAFEEHGAFERATAQRFLDAILSRGGSRDELAAFVEFRGRPPEIRALLEQNGIRPGAAGRSVPMEGTS